MITLKRLAIHASLSVILSDLGEDEAVLTVQRLLYPSEDV